MVVEIRGLESQHAVRWDNLCIKLVYQVVGVD